MLVQIKSAKGIVAIGIFLFFCAIMGLLAMVLVASGAPSNIFHTFDPAFSPRCDDEDGQSPSPEATPKPACSSSR